MSPSWNIGGKRPRVKEGDITKQIRLVLKSLRIPHFKHFGGPLSAKGVSDIIGVIPGTPRPTIKDKMFSAKGIIHFLLGREEKDKDEAIIALAEEVSRLREQARGFFLEVKVPGKVPRPEQQEFLDSFARAGALAFYADNVWDVVNALAKNGYEPAVAMAKMFPGRST